MTRQQPRQVELDVREYHARGQEPFADIMAVVGSLQDGQDFVLINTFEPLPLYRVMAAKGFAHRAERLGPRHWRITFSRPGQGGPSAGATGSEQAPPPAVDDRLGAACDEPDPSLPWIEIDNRGLAPPEPMVRILAALEEARPGQGVVAINDRQPVFLFPVLEERGVRHRSEERPDGTFRITAWRPPAAAGASAAPDLPPSGPPEAKGRAGRHAP